MSYEQYYGLNEQPFAITPDPRFFFENEQHTGALIRIQHAIDASRGLTVVIGDMGLGKTFLSRKVYERLQSEEAKYDVSLLIIIHHEVSANWLLKKIATQVGVEFPGDENSVLISQICKRLLEINEDGKKAVIMIDEAHMLQSKEIYEELRGLLNVELQSHKLLNIVLFGPPELEGYMQQDPPLVSRIGMKLKLEPLDDKNTWGYINHRLEIAGAKKEIFTREACSSVWEATLGVPRLINTVSDNVLLEGYIEKKEQINPHMVEKVVENLGLKKDFSDPGSPKKKKIGTWYYT